MGARGGAVHIYMSVRDCEDAGSIDLPEKIESTDTLEQSTITAASLALVP